VVFRVGWILSIVSGERNARGLAMRSPPRSLRLFGGVGDSYGDLTPASATEGRSQQAASGGLDVNVAIPISVRNSVIVPMLPGIRPRTMGQVASLAAWQVTRRDAGAGAKGDVDE
jgi:hypothetical protein